MGNEKSPTRRRSTVSRRRMLQATAAVGTAAVGFSSSAAAGPTFELSDCVTQWDDAPEAYPEIDLTVDDPTASGIPESPSEILLYAHGWLSEGHHGRNQAFTFEQALRQAGYDHPVVNATWESNDIDFDGASDRADRCGKRLADWLRAYRDEHPETRIRLAGLSLGARVPLATLEALAGDVTVASGSLFGGAVDVDEVCSAAGGYDVDAIDATTDAVYNYHSDEDGTICLFYRGWTGSAGLGCDGAGCEDRDEDGSIPNAFVDVDVTDEVEAHCDYLLADDGIVDRVVADFDEAD